MFCIVNELTAGFKPDYDDDGSPAAPFLQTMYTQEAMYRARTCLRSMRAAIELLITAWTRQSRFTDLKLGTQASTGLIRLVNLSRSLYVIGALLAYADRTFAQLANRPDETAFTQLIKRCNHYHDTNILIGGATHDPCPGKSVPDDELLFSAGYHSVGDKNNNTMLFSRALLSKDLLMSIHTQAGEALELLSERLDRASQESPARYTIGMINNGWDRLYALIYEHSPVPFGIEPGGDYKIGM